MVTNTRISGIVSNENERSLQAPNRSFEPGYRDLQNKADLNKGEVV
jgi:hypothetical protein